MTLLFQDVIFSPKYIFVLTGLGILRRWCIVISLNTEKKVLNKTVTELLLNPQPHSPAGTKL